MKVRISPLRRKLEGREVRVPGDKSISHRALLFAALAEGESRIAGLAPGGDVRSTARALAQLGVPILRGDGTPWLPPPSSLEFPEADEPTFVSPSRPQGSAPLPERDPDMGHDDAIVLGQGLAGLREPLARIDCGNSGTTLRLLCGILAGAGVPASLTGDESLSRRPMERVAGPLRELGALIETGEKGRPPVRVRAGQPLRAAAVVSQLASAQVKSAVLLAGLFCEGETSFTEPSRSRDHTERLLRAMGADLSVRGNTVAVRGRAPLHGVALEVPGDLSSAAFLLALSLIAPGGELSLLHVGVNPTRAGFLDALAMFGARAKLELADGSSGGEAVGTLTCGAQKLRGARLDGDLVLRAIDEVPILAVLGALAEGETVIRGAAELRVKESDRLAQMAAGLQAMGAQVEELPDGLRIVGTGKRLRGGAEIDSAQDHRIALAFAVAALGAEEPCTLTGAEWADVSFPGFFSLLRRLGAEVELVS